jgi:hypothetical protein
MPLSPVVLDNERDKFRETVAGDTAVAVVLEDVGETLGNRLSGTGTGNLVAFSDTPSQPIGFFGPLTDRKGIYIQPVAAQLYLGFDSSVSHVTGIKLFKDQLIYIEASELADIYIVAFTGMNIQARIWEAK